MNPRLLITNVFPALFVLSYLPACAYQQGINTTCTWQTVPLADTLLTHEETAIYAGYVPDAQDINKDGNLDIIAGNSFFVHPEQMQAEKWKKITPYPNAKIIIATTIDGDGNPDLIGITTTQVIWLEALDPEGIRWTATPVALMASAHSASPAANDIRDSTKELTFNGTTYLLEIPDDPEAHDWPIYAQQSSEKETNSESATSLMLRNRIDIDRDGDLDLIELNISDHGVLTLQLCHR